MLGSVSRSVHSPAPHRPGHVLIYQLDAEADELWRFVQQKANQPGIGLAIDAQSRQSIAFHVGDRSRARAQALWAKSPEVSPQQATFHTDQDDGYNGVTPAERHKAITKTARTTNHIEPVQQHLEATPVAPGARHAVIVQEGRNHIGAITFFSCHDNLEKAAALPL
jgi:insertion element IS1 protein InsB